MTCPVCSQHVRMITELFSTDHPLIRMAMFNEQGGQAHHAAVKQTLTQLENFS